MEGMNPEVVAHFCGELTLLKFFPSDDGGRRALFLMVGRMCANEDQVRWLVRRTLELCNEWPGPKALRQILCSKFTPADGVEASFTDVFPEGVPSEQIQGTGALAELEQWKREHPQEIAAPMTDIEEQITLTLRRPRPVPHVVPETPINTNFQPITQADIDRAEREYRERKLQQAAETELKGGS
jgi:hypothetical protein